MTKQDVRIEYQDFKDILELIIRRLRNNAIVKTGEDEEGYIISDYSSRFLLSKEWFSLNESIILKALDFLNSKNCIFHGTKLLQEYGLFVLLDFEDLEKEYKITITDKKGVLILHHLYDYIRSIYRDKEKQNTLMEFINKPILDLPKPRFKELHFLTDNESINEDNEDYEYITKIKQWKDFLVECSFIFDGNRRYPKIKDNKDFYNEKEEAQNNNGIDTHANEINNVQEVKKEEPILWLTYERQELFLNNRLIKECETFAGNDVILRILFEQPNKTLFRYEFEKHYLFKSIKKRGSVGYDKNFYQFLIDIGVSGKGKYYRIGELFFIDKTNDSIQLIDKIYKKDIEKFNLRYNDNLNYDNVEDLVNKMFETKAN